ncbi:hypothetical protein [Simiduia aestuariiviva]|uniref:Uncharacterized protein n=1 Tax=Simiduia aestuariiviva TaxID=1510459 RepID=A0A839UIX5_9GAMM|nr:hypothetical protein [Simiduia aestuariiviva]MBB3167503.1 hypothetical protein [Simiduia aestuariiviva]
MRKPVKFRLLFLVAALVIYVVGAHLLPEHISAESWSMSLLVEHAEWQRLLAVTGLFFGVMPLLYWYCVIRMGQQAWWKLLLIFSLSSLIARYTYPEDIAQYFEFITWLRYPIIAVLLALELYLMVTICRSLWAARNLTGDPRLHMLAQYQVEHSDIAQGADAKVDGVDAKVDATSESHSTEQKASAKAAKQLELALTFAHEPASWYYAIPRLTRNHTPALANIVLRSATRSHFFMVLAALLLGAVGSYVLLADWSVTAATLVATFIAYGSVMFVANYRVSRYYSLYLSGNSLVINNGWWGFCAIDRTVIARCERGSWSLEDDSEGLFIGRKPCNIKIQLTQPQHYFSGIATMKDAVSTIYLTVDDSQRVVAQLTEETVLNVA